MSQYSQAICTPTVPPAPADDRGTESGTASLSPLIMFAASPGTITGVITLSVAHSEHEIPVTALVAVVVAIGLTWVVMVMAAGKSSAPKPSVVHDVTSRFMGLIVLAMGVQFGLNGLNKFFES